MSTCGTVSSAPRSAAISTAEASVRSDRSDGGYRTGTTTRVVERIQATQDVNLSTWTASR
jgi:hypothetical protein